MERMESKLSVCANKTQLMEAGYYVCWHKEKGWISVTDRLPAFGQIVYAYGYRWDADADSLSGFMYRCFLSNNGLWTYRPIRDDGRDETIIFESHEIDFWREIPKDEE